MPARTSAPTPVITPTTGTPASTPATIVRRMTSASPTSAVPRNHATGRSLSSPGSSPTPASTVPAWPVATGRRGTAATIRRRWR